MLISVCVSGSAQNKETLKERIARWKSDMAEFNEGRSGIEQKQAVLDTIAWLQAEQALKDSSFVIEADAVTFKYGTRVQVNSTTNFISMEGDRAVIQISPSYVYGGPNGVGGITVDGTVSNVSLTSDKKGRIRITMNISGAVINARVDISMHPESDNVQVVVSPNFNSQTIRLEGKLVPYKFSRVIEGVSI